MGFCNLESSSRRRKEERGRKNVEDEKSMSKIIWVSATWCSPVECESWKAEGILQNMGFRNLEFSLQNEEDRRKKVEIVEVV